MNSSSHERNGEVTRYVTVEALGERRRVESHFVAARTGQGSPSHRNPFDFAMTLRYKVRICRIV